MASATLPRRAYNLNFIREHQNNQTSNIETDDEETSQHHDYYIPKPIRTGSCDQSEVQLTLTNNNNRLKHLCSRLKRRFSLTKERRTRSEDTNGCISERQMIFVGNYKSFSSSIDGPSNEFEWPDFEKIYETIPPCLINALPGLDDFSIEKNYDYSSNIMDAQTDLSSMEQMNLFLQCKRGKYFRRNAICQKLDKSQYNRQLDIFIQQLMVEKLMRTWT
jgi:hypothetical protein